MSSAELVVLADIRRYKSELAKMEGVTDREAFKAAVAMEKRLSRAQDKAARKAEREAAKAAQSWQTAFSAVGAGLGVGVGMGVESIMSNLLQVTRQVTGALYELGIQAAATREQVEDMATDAGVAVDTIDALRLAAVSSREEFAQYRRGLVGFASRIDDAKRGTGEARDALEALGFTQEELNEQGRTLDQTLREVIVRLQGIDDEGTRAAYATDVLGSKGTSLLRVLGGRELADFEALLRSVRGDQEAVAATTQAWRTAQDQLSVSTDLLGQALVSAFGETGVTAVNALAKTVVFVSSLIKTAADNLDTLIAAGSRYGGSALSGFAQRGFTGALSSLVGQGLADVGVSNGRTAVRAGTGQDLLQDGDFFKEVWDRYQEAQTAFDNLFEQASGEGTGPTGDPSRSAGAGSSAAAGVRAQVGQVAEAIEGSLDLTSLGRAHDQLVEIEATLTASTDPIDKLNAKYDEMADKISASAALLEDTDRLKADLHLLELERLAEVERVRQEFADAEAARQAELAAHQMAQQQQAAAGVLGLAAQVTGGLGNLLSQRARQDEQFARETFGLRKGMAITEALIQTYMGAAAAYASTAAIPIVGPVMAPIAAGVAGAFGLAQVGLIAAQQPSYHTGGMTDEMLIRAKRNEYMVAAPVVERVGGSQGVEDALAGGGVRVVHAHFDLSDGEVINAVAYRVLELVEDRMAPGLRGRELV